MKVSKSLMGRVSARIPLFAVLFALVVLGASSAMAQTAADPTTITAAATTAFEAVTVLVVAMISFFVIAKIIKRIRG
jgi:hypothetical protein